jgi:hypothetical protein
VRVIAGRRHECPQPNVWYPSGTFSIDSSMETHWAGEFFVCGYLAVSGGWQIAQSDNVTTYPCSGLPDTNFSVDDLALSTKRYANPSTGKSQTGDYSGRFALTVQSQAADLGQIPGGQLDFSASAGLGASIDGYDSTQSTTVKGEAENLKESGTVQTVKVIDWPSNGAGPGSYGACVKADGTVAELGPDPTSVGVTVHTVKITWGAACQGGTATVDGQPVTATNGSKTYTTVTPYGVEDCNGHITPAKSGKCTHLTFVAKGYKCVHGKVGKAPVHKKKKKHKK